MRMEMNWIDDEWVHSVRYLVGSSGTGFENQKQKRFRHTCMIHMNSEHGMDENKTKWYPLELRKNKSFIVVNGRIFAFWTVQIHCLCVHLGFANEV